MGSDAVFVYPWREYAGEVDSSRRNGVWRYRATDAFGILLGTFSGYVDAKDAVKREWHRAHGNPRLVVTDGGGRLVDVGDVVTDFRGDTGIFEGVTSRGRTGTWKVTVDGREYYDSVFNLTVTQVTK